MADTRTWLLGPAISLPLYAPSLFCLLDWALSCPAPAWADTALTIPRLISAGHTPDRAETIARQVPAYGKADPAAVTFFARTIHAAWEDWERTRPLPRRAALTAAARTWVAHREKAPVRISGPVPP